VVGDSASWVGGDGLGSGGVSLLAQRAASEGPRWTRAVESGTASAHYLRVGEMNGSLDGRSEEPFPRVQAVVSFDDPGSSG